jgi:hypothetical protein
MCYKISFLKVELQIIIDEASKAKPSALLSGKS